MREITTIRLNRRELATVLAGLRLRQVRGLSSFEPEHITNIATGNGEFEEMVNVEIDALCDRISSGDRETWDIIARLINEVDYLRETGDHRDSLKNHPTLTQQARELFGIPDEEEEPGDA
jgi:hypothetical protein